MGQIHLFKNCLHFGRAMYKKNSLETKKYVNMNIQFPNLYV